MQGFLFIIFFPKIFGNKKTIYYLCIRNYKKNFTAMTQETQLVAQINGKIIPFWFTEPDKMVETYQEKFGFSYHNENIAMEGWRRHFVGSDATIIEEEVRRVVKVFGSAKYYVDSQGIEVHFGISRTNIRLNNDKYCNSVIHIEQGSFYFKSEIGFKDLCQFLIATKHLTHFFKYTRESED